MGNKESSHGQTFTLQKEEDAKNRGAVLKTFIDHYKYPNSGIIAINCLSNPPIHKHSYREFWV